MNKMTEIRWHGRGGQGAVTAGKLVAETALGADLFFQAFPDYGAERMGAPIRAFTRLSTEPITAHCAILEPNVVVILDPTLLGVVDVTEGLTADGCVIVNTTETPAQVRRKLKMATGTVYTVNASHIAIEELGRDITNTPMLGALCVATGLFSVDSVAEQIEKNFGKKMRKDVVEANIRAVRRAASEVQAG